jgi:ssDNA-binding replication factor A large subunit
MRIEEIESNSKVISLVVTIDSVEEPKTTPSGTQFQDGIVSDETGQVKIVFWDEQVGKFRVGDKILVNSGWAKTFNEELQISSGKFGKISLIPKKVA